MASSMPSGMSGARRVSQACGKEREPHCTYMIFMVIGISRSFCHRLISVPSSTCYMLTYDYLLNDTLPPLLPAAVVPLTAGITARTLITSIASPLELVRTNLQSTPLSPDTPHTLRSTLSSIGALARTHGSLHLWRGLGATLWRDVPFSGLYWAGYEICKRSLNRSGYKGPHVAFVSGALSGTAAALVTSPFDVLKTRRQALLMSGSVGTSVSTSNADGIVAVLKEIVRTEGISALYAGIMPRIAKIAPACGIMIACFEVCRVDIYYSLHIANLLLQRVLERS